MQQLKAEAGPERKPQITAPEPLVGPETGVEERGNQFKDVGARQGNIAIAVTPISPADRGRGMRAASKEKGPPLVAEGPEDTQVG